ncbi:MAG: hypothetical protein OES37_07850 [Chromatiales bacterium]|nr:hypothetical protein [Chromatiales bacterium]
MASLDLMRQSQQILDRLRGFIGRSADFRGSRFRVIEVLEHPARLVLQSIKPGQNIIADSYGHPWGRGRSYLELPVFDDNGRVSPELGEICVAEPAESD